MTADGDRNDKSVKFKRNESEDPIDDENLLEGEGNMAIQKANE